MDRIKRAKQLLRRCDSAQIVAGRAKPSPRGGGKSNARAGLGG
jgi:hypothetical protein